MKQFRIFILAIVGCIMLTACPGGGGEGPEEILISGKEYTDTYEVEASGCNDTYELKMLSAELASLGQCPEWLSVSALTYTSGSPQIKIIANPNNGGERKHKVEIQTVYNDKLTLTVVQAAKEHISSDIEDIHNETSSNPAYSKNRR